MLISISEEDPGTLHNDSEEKGGPKIRRTFSYFRSKMSKKGKVRPVVHVETVVVLKNIAVAHSRLLKIQQIACWVF